MMLPRFCICK